MESTHKKVGPVYKRRVADCRAAVRPNTLEARLATAHARILMAQRYLLHPTAEALDHCSCCLRAVGDELRVLPKILSKDQSGDLRAMAGAVRDELQQLNTLLQRAATMYMGLVSLLSAKRFGYTRKGTPAELSYRQQLMIKG